MPPSVLIINTNSNILSVIEIRLYSCAHYFEGSCVALKCDVTDAGSSYTMFKSRSTRLRSLCVALNLGASLARE